MSQHSVCLGEGPSEADHLAFRIVRLSRLSDRHFRQTRKERGPRFSFLADERNLDSMQHIIVDAKRMLGHTAACGFRRGDAGRCSLMRQMSWKVFPALQDQIAP